MKNKILLGFLVLVLVVSVFFGGRFFERQRVKKEASIQNTFTRRSFNEGGSNPPTPLNSPIQNLTVVEVTDGDTLKLSSGKTFRLYGVNAPEVKEPYFEEAKAFSQNLVLNKEISFEQEEKYKEDKFGRILGYVFVNGVNLNLELVRNGLARVVLYEKRAKIKYQDELLQAEKEAGEKRVGIWKR